MARASHLILASQSPRRHQLLREAGYEFEVWPPSETAECGLCSRETPPEMVGRLAWQKAADVARKTSEGLILACDTVAECMGHTLGKPGGVDHAREMLHLLRGREHSVYSGVSLWRRSDNKILVRVDRTRLEMAPIDDRQLEQYLASGAWRGKAGAFGYQDRLGWLTILEGSESNVVGLPMELLERMLGEFEED